MTPQWARSKSDALEVLKTLFEATFVPLFLTRILPLLTLSATLLPAQMRYAPSPDAVVSLRDGKLQGAEPAPGIRAFLGIPYAKPPVGPLRWRPPQPFGPLSSDPAKPRVVTAHGTPCAQQHFGWNNASADKGEENCLFLNVWAPKHGEHLPVMVYIHGGSNTAGSASEELSNGLQLVPRGVLLVTFEYRLGIFGFFRSPALDAESGYNGSGNYGLMDQIAVLQWVQDNIAAFGGDPHAVTVFGQSAGAVDTGLLMASPLARGLFARALEESGQVTGLMPTASRQQSEGAWSPATAALGPDLAAMRAASTADVLSAEHNLPKPPPEEFWGHRGASVDGHILPAPPAEIFAKGDEAPVPLLLGSNVQEIVPHDATPEQTRRLIKHDVGSERAAALDAIYTKSPENPLEGGPAARYQTDRDFRCPVLQVASWHASHGFPTFVYQFDRSAGSSRPAQHSAELRFVFGFAPPDANARNQNAPSPDDLTAANTIQAYWTTFARSGAPSPAPGLPIWPRFRTEDAPYLHFSAASATPRSENHLGGLSCSVLNANSAPASH